MNYTDKVEEAGKAIQFDIHSHPGTSEPTSDWLETDWYSNSDLYLGHALVALVVYEKYREMERK